MSKYTTQLRNIVENYSYNDFTLNNNQRIEKARPYIFNFDYPIWDANYKKELETKIIKHFYTKEIGCETLGLWQFYLEERLNLIMPYYNKIYATTIKDYDYLTNVKLTETLSNNKTDTKNSEFTGTNDNTNTENTTQSDTGENTSKNIKSDTPQANYDGLDYANELEDLTVNNSNTTTVDKNNTGNVTSHTVNTDSNTTTENYTKENSGNTGSKSFTELLVEYRDSLINIDMMVINELKDLFMMIY